METKKRFKMYKSGKKWLVAGIIAGGMATVGTVGNAHADEVKTDATVQTEQVSSAAQPTSEAASTSSSATVASSVASSSAVSSAASSSASSVASSAASEASSSAALAASSSAKAASTFKKTSTNKYEGTDGTAKWYITNDNELHIEAGQLNNSGQGSWVNPKKYEDDNGQEYINYDYDSRDDIKSIIIEGPLDLNNTSRSEASSVFSNYKNLENIVNSKYIQTGSSKWIDFSDNPKLKSLDISTWNFDNMEDMGAAFANDESLTSVKGHLKVTNKVKNISSLFSNDSSLTDLDVSNWDISNVYFDGIDSVFSGTTNLQKIDMSAWTVGPTSYSYEGVLIPNLYYKDAQDMFKGSGVKNLDFSKWETQNSSGTRGLVDLSGNSALETVTIGSKVDSNAIILPDGAKWVSSLDGKTYSSEEVMALYKDGKGQTATYTLASENNGTDTGKTDGNTDGKTDGNKTDGNTDGKTDGNKTDGNTDGKTDGNKTDGNTDGKTDGNKTDGNTDGKTDSNKTDSKADDKTNTNKSQSKDNQSKESATGTDQKQESKKNTTVVTAKSNDNSSSNNGDGVTTTVTNNTSSSEKRQSPQFMKGFLPQTGENNTTASILTVVGVALAGLLASFGIVKKSRKH
ncbi:BspA family leucine-rich repeat surface protein [Pediococcus stilesii]|uniref:BspA family leucine-rich repeat surface protein n=1 Tax=Pediococcus stilesii TaxID=331679 RepID=A0A5R9BU03_9LACO|nr:BspA family leucine-rich repeat surface protein [Pediococcus stilesii]TLQ04069.1 BspA family leucine-rich repeat surface protein [Pediococcus stilesii]